MANDLDRVLDEIDRQEVDAMDALGDEWPRRHQGRDLAVAPAPPKPPRPVREPPEPKRAYHRHGDRPGWTYPDEKTLRIVRAARDEIQRADAFAVRRGY